MKLLAVSEGPAKNDPWLAITRVQEFRGEERANLLRAIGIALFYIVELANYHGIPALGMERVSGVDDSFHAAVTALAVAWIMVSVGVVILLRNKIFPSALKYVSTAADLVLLTAILTVADGPKSVMVIAYFLVLGLSALRFSLPLVAATTAGAIAGYLFLVGVAFFERPEIRVPRYHQVIVVLGLALLGIVLSQLLRSGRKIARELLPKPEGDS